MKDLSKINLISMGRDEILNITKEEIEEYKQIRTYNKSLGDNLILLKNLQTLERRLQRFGFGDSEVLGVRTEIKDLLNEDAYRNVTQFNKSIPFTSAEEYINSRLRSK